MVMLYVGGKVVSWNEAEKLFADAARNERIEFRDETGLVLATSVPEEEHWADAITQADIDRVAAEPGYTFEEVKKRLGWE